MTNPHLPNHTNTCTLEPDVGARFDEQFKGDFEHISLRPLFELLELRIKHFLAAELARKDEEKAADTKRLDFLDKCNQVLNEKCASDYGWKLILNHNVNRLMSEKGFDSINLSDDEGGDKKLKSCRDAIDQQMKLIKPTPEKEAK